MSFVLGAIATAPATERWNSATFRISCLDQPFLRISAVAVGWSSVPHVDLALKDPVGRTAGNYSRYPRVPSFRYGEVAEIPNQFARRRALHLEICNASAGRYVLTVTEHVSEDYYLEILGDNSSVAYWSPTLLFHANPARTCEYRFQFIMQRFRVAIRWLDADGDILSPSEPPVCKPIGKA